ncbi:hypothetical protein [Streptomyces nigrescens]
MGLRGGEDYASGGDELVAAPAASNGRLAVCTDPAGAEFVVLTPEEAR